MPFTQPVAQPGDTEEFLRLPHHERLRRLTVFWAEYGFGTQTMVHCIYVIKLLVLSIGGGVLAATLTSDVGGPLDVGEWWNEPIVYQKIVLWTLFLELLGLGGTWGPLAAHFKPMTGGVTYWVRRGTIKLPPWPNTVPGTRGDSRNLVDIVLYVACLLSFLAAILSGSSYTHLSRDTVVDGRPVSGGLVAPVMFVAPIVLLVLCGLRDKILFLAARSEQHLPVLLISAAMGVTAWHLTLADFIVLAKLLIVIVWCGAAVSKMNKHFDLVVPPMISNTPWMPRALKVKHYRNFPDDLRPSRLGWAMAHITGTLYEMVIPLTLLFSTSRTVTLIAVLCMVGFHVFIISTFPLAVPLEWNALFAYVSVFLFIGFPAGAGFGVGDLSSAWILPVVLFALLFFPVLGNLRPDLVSFLPSLRQYAGNWASAIWAFKPGMEARLNELGNPAKNQIDQLVEGMKLPADVAERTLQLTIGWRSMHSQGRGLFSVMQNHLGDAYEEYSLREAEFLCNAVVGWNFGEGHLHDDQLTTAIQRRLGFEPGDVVVVWVESQPINRSYLRYMVIDLALGIVERGRWEVADAVAEQPWLPNGPIPVQVDWRRESDAPTRV